MDAAPLDVVYLGVSDVLENRLLHGSRLGIHVPDEHLPVVGNGADVILSVRGPSYAVDCSCVTEKVTRKLRNGNIRNSNMEFNYRLSKSIEECILPDIEDDGSRGVGGDGDQVVGVLLVPGQPQQRRQVRRLVDHRRVLESPKP